MYLLSRAVSETFFRHAQIASPTIGETKPESKGRRRSQRSWKRGKSRLKFSRVSRKNPGMHRNKSLLCREWLSGRSIIDTTTQGKKGAWGRGGRDKKRGGEGDLCLRNFRWITIYRGSVGTIVDFLETAIGRVARFGGTFSSIEVMAWFQGHFVGKGSYALPSFNCETVIGSD